MIRKHVDFEAPGFGELAEPVQPWLSYGALVGQLQPLAWWRSLDGQGPTWPDATGQGHDATLQTGSAQPAPGAIHRDADPAVELANNPSLYTAPHASLSGFDDFTLLLWFWWGWPSKTFYGGVHYLAGVYDITTDQRSWAVLLVQQDAEFRINLSNDGAGFTPLAGIARADLDLQRWHCLAWTRAGSNVSAYLDGQLHATDTFSGTLHQPANVPLVLAARSDGGGSIDGTNRLDEPAIWNTALDPHTIASLYHRGAGP